ncbi:MAG: phosphoenolpyruvate carboxylase [Bdellovibrionales bacterium]|nr:phosphoenolpyruvate carboxylase [Bdellovibrionales bacterium]
MLNSVNDNHIELLNPRAKHFKQIQELCLKVYPFHKPWSIKQLESHRSYFPDGQLIVYDHSCNKVIGSAFSLIIPWEDYSPQDNWGDFTSGGFFHNHNPKKGKTLYGAEVMVDPAYRGRGIGKLLYEGRREICYKYDLKRIRAGARLRGYSKFQNKMTADEYTRKVVTGDLSDPTLSFQLKQGFKVIDVAKNYLIDDPESLGFAAVIEWLNPKLITENDIKKQTNSISSFINGEKFLPEYLPRELRRLVRRSTLYLGQVIKEWEGIEFYQKIEAYRKRLKKTRFDKGPFLEKILKSLEKESSDHRLKIAHAFALQLEIVNACESAYRTWRLQQKSIPQGFKNKVMLNFVLTAHPTESRSKEIIETLGRIVELLLEGLQNNFVFREVELLSQIRLLWLHPLSKTKTPSVIDEAEYLFSRVFKEDLFDFILEEKPSYELKLRTWVGGDKDGHPGVDQHVMKECFEHSRSYIVETLKLKLEYLQNDIEKLVSIGIIRKSKLDQLDRLWDELENIQHIKPGDGMKVRKWKTLYLNFLKSAHPFIQKHHEIKLINQLLSSFPGFVLPIELREDAEKIHVAYTDKKSSIRKMLEELVNISGPTEIINYARGLVVSHCETNTDIDRAANLILKTCKSKNLPVIPLFESREALNNSKKIIDQWLKVRKNYECVKRHWNNMFEIMLGYSDSSKQFGVLPSRRLIQRTMFKIEKSLKTYSIVPIFFHGSGGSVARGGGSLKEQVSWWPNSAINKPKQTIQGEMVQRLFATPEILNSQCIHLSNESQLRRIRRSKIDKSKELDQFIKIVEESYKKLVDNKKLLNQLIDATPYKYLDVLKLGSRPSKRPDTLANINSLRAIPWVLCWTQTRILWPSWWGIGQAWKNSNDEDRLKLKSLFATSPFFCSFVKTLGYTLAKVDLDVWRLYLPKYIDPSIVNLFEEELKSAKEFVFFISDKNSLLWHKPWLEESIRLRSPHIHILNLLQIIAMSKNDEKLLRETLVGIACGMLTTG